MSNFKQSNVALPIVLAIVSILGLFPACAAGGELIYQRSNPPLEVKFDVSGDHYNGNVDGGNLFLATDIPTAPIVRWKQAHAGKLYTLLMLDFDGNAYGSYPDKVAIGENSTVRHWIVGNIPGELLRGKGYVQSDGTKTVTVVQPYRQPRIPMVSDRYGLYLFEQTKRIDFANMDDNVVNFDHAKYIDSYRLGKPIAANYFVAVYTSESPFSGKAFHGNDVSQTWHKDLGNGSLPACSR